MILFFSSPSLYSCQLTAVFSSCVFYGDLHPTEGTVNPLTARKLERLLVARKSFAYGPTVDYFSDQNRNCVGFVRRGDQDLGRNGCVVILSNKEVQEGWVTRHCMKPSLIGILTKPSTLRT